MTVITVEGLGSVEIKGDTPSAEEQRMIMGALQQKGSAQPGNQQRPDTGNAIAAAGGGEGIDAEIADWSKYGRRGVEHADVPTIARLPFSQLWGKDVPTSSSLAMMATLATDNPDARQQISLKHLPGAKGSQDRYGNPMIEYKGKPYYMSRPGEFDATDATRIGAGVAASLPAALLAPASLPLAAGVGGATSAAMSLGEDAATRAAGGTAQKYDPAKAGIAGVLGTVLPFGIAKVVMPVAGRLNALLRSGRVLDDAAIRELGLDPTILTPDLRQRITTAYHRTFGDRQASQSAYRGGLADEFNTAVTRGEISQNAGQQSREKMLSGPANSEAERIMQEFRTGPRLEGNLAGTGGQEAERTAAQNVLRGQVGGGTPLTPMQAGETLRRGYGAADAQAGVGVDQLYNLSKNPALLASAGMPTEVPLPFVHQLGDVVRANLARTGPGRTIVNDDFPSLAPNAARALAQIDRWRQGGLGPRNATSINWEGVDNLRQTLRQYAEAANAPNAMPRDSAAMQRIMEGFDQHFGQHNSILGMARNAHSERMVRFNPGDEGQDKATTAALTALSGPEGGTSLMRTIFGPKVKTGEATQMIDHLNTQVFPNQPQARDAIKEQALRRLVVDENTGATLSPRRTVTAMERALDGDAEAPLYERLFSTDERARMRRYLDLQRAIAQGRESPNPSKSGLLLSGIVKHGLDRGTGAGIGYALGAPFGLGEVGGVAGGAAGSGLSKAIPRIQAQSAINPPANYAPAGPQGRPALRGGLLATPPAADQTMDELHNYGPADRMMRSLLMGGP